MPIKGTLVSRRRVVTFRSGAIKMNKPILAFLFTVVLFTAPLWANEGSDQYPNGAENWLAGAVPPAGSYYVNYFGFYSGKLKDGSGANANLNGTTPSVNATFDAFRFVQVTHHRMFGADYAVQVIVPVVHQSVNMNGIASKTSVGDIFVNPMILGWHHPQWHALASVDILLPTGYYNQNDPRVSVGANYCSFDSLVAVSAVPKSGWEGSAKLMYNIKTTNPATNYHSGQDFHTDFAFGKHFQSWMAGATGYALKQTTNDTFNSQIEPAAPGLWTPGRKGQVLAIGPTVGYTNQHHIAFVALWQHETLVRNRFGGDKFWFKMIIPLDGLFSSL
jgi:hypothetical protein